MGSAITEMVKAWLMVNVGALLVLAVLSYYSSRWALDGLEFLDRWLDKTQRVDQRQPPLDHEG